MGRLLGSNPRDRKLVKIVYNIMNSNPRDRKLVKIVYNIMNRLAVMWYMGYVEFPRENKP